MARSQRRSGDTRGAMPERLVSAVVGAASDAARLLDEYDERVLGGYDRETDERLAREGLRGYAAGTPRFPTPRLTGSDVPENPQATEESLAAYHRLFTDVAGGLRRSGATLLSKTPEAEAARYYWRRGLAAVTAELQRRAGHRRLRSGRPETLGNAFAKILNDIQEALLPWGIVRELIEPLVNEAKDRAELARH